VNPIAVVNDFASYGYPIHKGTVVAVEVDEFIPLVDLLNLTVSARDRGTDQAQLIRFVTAN
jgi:hypothetical protein